jgi:uncharacterized protein YjbI with pentapeptide repeats
VLAGANLKGADLGGANLRDADLSGAILEGVSFRGTQLEGAKLVGARLGGADLSQSIGLSQRQLDGACGNAAGTALTRLPPSLVLRPCE